MSDGAQRATSRSEFLKQAAGATAVVAGAGVGAGVLASGAAASATPRAAAQRSYTAGRFALELDGVSCGWFVGLDGGDLDCDVVLDPVGSDNIQRKHVAGVKYEDLTLQVGSNMDASFYDWVKAAFDKGYLATKSSASISQGDSSYNEVRHRDISQMSISSVTIPALDASSKDSAYIAVSVTPAKVTDAPPSGQPVQGARQKPWLPANFVFQVDGAETSRVATIDAFTWKCTVAADGSQVLSMSDISVTFPRSSAPSWQEWYDNQASGANDERDGTLTLIGSGYGTVITIGLSNLGLYRLRPDPAKPSSRMRATMYCEKGGWDIKTNK